MIPIHHITSHRITSHHITSHHITSHHITSHHITSYRQLKAVGGWNAFITSSLLRCISVTTENVHVNGIHWFRTRSDSQSVSQFVTQCKLHSRQFSDATLQPKQVHRTEKRVWSRFGDSTWLKTGMPGFIAYCYTPASYFMSTQFKHTHTRIRVRNVLVSISPINNSVLSPILWEADSGSNGAAWI
jgi:hypothetical protein